eukprot:1799811-Amphidinium_carterae.1
MHNVTLVPSRFRISPARESQDFDGAAVATAHRSSRFHHLVRLLVQQDRVPRGMRHHFAGMDCPVAASLEGFPSTLKELRLV